MLRGSSANESFGKLRTLGNQLVYEDFAEGTPNERESNVFYSIRHLVVGAEHNKDIPSSGNGNDPAKKSPLVFVFVIFLPKLPVAASFQPAWANPKTKLS